MLTRTALGGLGPIACIAGAMISLLAVACGGDDGDGSGGAASSSPAATSANGTGGGSATTTSGSTGPGSGGATTGSGGGAGGGTADTWANYAMGFFATYCVECHGAGNPMRDYTTIADVKVDSAEIRCGVSTMVRSGCGASPVPEQFPIDNATHTNPKPDLLERARIVAWIEAGLPE